MNRCESVSVKWNPDEYAKHSTAQLGWARDLIGRLQLHGDEAVLDVGCGDGKVTAEIAEAVPGGYALGIDSSPEAITYAKGEFDSLSWGTVDYLRHTHIVLEIRDADSDVVYQHPGYAEAVAHPS